MKKAKFIRALLYGFMAFALYSCSDVLPQSENIVDMGTRALTSDAEDGFYYYYKGSKIPLPISVTKRYVLTKTSDCTTPYSTQGTASRIIDLGSHVDISTYSQDNQLAELVSDENVVAVEYVVGDSIPRAISNLFYIKLKNEGDISVLEEEATKIGCKVEARVASDPLWVRLSNDKNSMYASSLEASNHLYETGRFADVDPGFIFNFQCNSAPTDVFYGAQWGMGYKGINVENVWMTNKGKPYITTAIIDYGIYKQHQDLAGVMHPYSYDCATGANSVTPKINHATLIAGIIAANHNGIGIAGIAPNTKLMDICVPLLADDAYNEKLTNGINMAWQHGADIINMSIGDQGGMYHAYLHSALLESALDNALTKGRNGKGCVFVFASGNHEVVDYPGYVNKDVLVVGSISEDGQVASDSGRGEALDVVAPGVSILSTNWDGGYYSDDGTSFAAPHAAGLAALILSEDSTLTQKDVCSLIMASAKNDAWNKNSGYGCINADVAFKILRGRYFTIRSRRRGNGTVAFGNSEYYVTRYSGNVRWSQEGGIDLRPWPATNSVIVNPDFDGYSKKVTLKADFTYKGYPISISSNFTLARDPIIYGIEKLELYSTDDMWSFKINCGDPNAEAICTGDNVIEFPYAMDADFIGTDPSLYFSIDRSWGKKDEYKVTIQTKNKYTGDMQDFVITSGTGKIETFKGKPGVPVE